MTPIFILLIGVLVVLNISIFVQSQILTELEKLRKILDSRL